MNEYLQKAINEWKKRTLRKGPFKLYSTGPNADYHDGDTAYTIIFKDKGKVKIGVLEDGMWLRYGISTFGTLSTPSPTGLWQSRAGTVSEDQLNEMIKHFNGESELPEFDLDTLKNLKH